MSEKAVSMPMSEAPRSAIADSLAFAQATIMMVDDEPLVTEVVRLYLEDAGYQRFVTTDDSTTACELVAKHQPDVVLLDLMMPRMSGFEVLAALRAHPRTEHLPVIVLTSSTDPNNKLKALELGANDILSKPVDASELVLRLRNTLAAKAHQDRLAYLDSVTGCANARMFSERLKRVLADYRRNGHPCVVCRIGLDRLGHVSDVLGQSVADDLLRALVARLEGFDFFSDLDPGDTMVVCEQLVARIGSDELAMLLVRKDPLSVVHNIASSILSLLAEHYQHVRGDLYVEPALGVALVPDDGLDAEQVMARAGAALTQARQSALPRLQFSSDELHARSRDRLWLETDLRHALERGQFEVFYQPKIALDSGAVSGAEALLRWMHPQRGMVNPEQFITVAEDNGEIVGIGAWVLAQACQQATQWQRNGVTDLSVSVNVSTRQFQEESFLQTVAGALASSGLPPRRLVLEVTETLVMRHPKWSVQVLQELRRLGVRTSVDDFGTGYSSLSYLKALPLNELKIDRSFIADISDDNSDTAIVGAVLALAHRMGLSVVAEGVEQTVQAAFLRANGCQEAQGFLFAKPMTSEDFMQFLVTHKASAAA